MPGKLVSAIEWHFVVVPALCGASYFMGNCFSGSLVRLFGGCGSGGESCQHDTVKQYQYKTFYRFDIFHAAYPFLALFGE